MSKQANADAKRIKELEAQLALLGGGGAAGPPAELTAEETFALQEQKKAERAEKKAKASGSRDALKCVICQGIQYRDDMYFAFPRGGTPHNISDAMTVCTAKCWETMVITNCEVFQTNLQILSRHLEPQVDEGIPPEFSATEAVPTKKKPKKKPKKADIPCRYFKEGKCTKGDRCPYKH